MDSKEVLQQYIVGAMKSQSAIAELEKNLVDTSDFLKMQEAARSRYVIGFIRRVVQFKREEASAKDICLNIRDLILVLGRVKLTEKLYTVVKEYGTEFDLVYTIFQNGLNLINTSRMCTPFAMTMVLSLKLNLPVMRYWQHILALTPIKALNKR